MTGTDFIDALERELRAASRRRVRLAVARMPPTPAGAAAIVVALAVCSAVAFPLLQTHSRSSAGSGSGSGHSRVSAGVTTGHPATAPVREVLAGDRIGRAAFGDRAATVVHRLKALLGRPPSKPYRVTRAGGGVDHEVSWPRLQVFFGSGRLVGYSYGQSHGQPTHARVEPVLATEKGLRVGDTVAAAKRLYGSTFHVTAEQGGAWFVHTPHGRLMGFTSEVTELKGKILTIEAGHVGGPALTP